FTSKAQTVIRGGENFRPVAIATAPDGALYLSDWVDKSYPVHGKGRIWRLRMKAPPPDDGLRVSQVAGLDPSKLRQLLNHPKVETRTGAGPALAKKGRAAKEVVANVLQTDPDPRTRTQALWAAAAMEDALAIELIEPVLTDAAPEVRAEAVRLLGSL